MTYLIGDSLEILPTLGDKSYDFCLTDFPYNVDFKGTKSENRFKGVYYTDNQGESEYQLFCEETFNELSRITNGMMIFCGNMNQYMWMQIAKPRDILIWHKPNCQGRGSSYYLNKHEIRLSYGTHRKMPTSVITQNVKSYPITELRNSIHPCPSSLDLYRFILDKIQPKSVLDPFLGSGTTAAACEMLGIPYLGIEKEKAYIPDIEKRIKQGQQSSLMGYLE